MIYINSSPNRKWNYWHMEVQWKDVVSWSLTFVEEGHAFKIKIIKTIEIIKVIKLIKITKIIKIIKKIRIIEINKTIKTIKIIKIIKSIMSCMSFLFGGHWSTDKIISVLVYIFIVLCPVWAGINNSVSCFETYR